MHQQAQYKGSKINFASRINFNQKKYLTNDSKEEEEKEKEKFMFFDSSDNYIKKILMENDWKVSDYPSRNIALKWVYSTKMNTFSQLSNNQRINHFSFSHILTTKLGLYKTLTASQGIFLDDAGRNHMHFYPRSYDLSLQFDTFVNDFKRTAIINLLKKLMIAIEIEAFDYFHRFNRQSMNNHKGDQQNILQRLLKLKKDKRLWQQNDQVLKRQRLRLNKHIVQSVLFYFALLFTLDTDFTEKNMPEEEIEQMVSYSLNNPPYTDLHRHFQADKDNACFPSNQTFRLFFLIYKLCFKRFPSFKADGLRNIWAIKTSDSSRGRSVFFIQSLQEIKILNNGTRLIQKYVENVWICYQEYLRQQTLLKFPFLKKLYNKKFDARIWVLVTSFAPLEAYVYEEGYLKIALQKYQLSDIDQSKTHLTNFSTNWNNQPSDCENSYVLLSQFLAFLQHENLKPQSIMRKEINQLIYHVLQAADLKVHSNEPKSFELFGFDVIFDSSLKPWLLECNMSPACKQRGKLASILQDMGRGLLSLVNLIPKNSMQSKWVLLSAERNSKQQKNIRPKQMMEQKLKKCISLKYMKNKQKENMLALPSISNDCITNKIAKHELKDLYINGSRLKKKKLFILDRYISTYTSVVKIQRFIKSLLFNKQQYKSLPSLKGLMIIQLMAKIINRRRSKYAKKLIKQCRKGNAQNIV